MKALLAATAVLMGLPFSTSLWAAPTVATSKVAAAIIVGPNATVTPPNDWRVTRFDESVRFTSPEGNLRIAIVSVENASDAAKAVKQALQLAEPGFAHPLRLASQMPARDGWDEALRYDYETPPAAKEIAQAVAFRRGHAWSVMTINGAIATLIKREGQIAALAATLRPAGSVRESFAGKQPHPMDATRIADLQQFVRASMATLEIPGVGLAVVDHGRIVYEAGLGLKDIASGAPVGEHTRFMVASNTKGMGTLLLAILVDRGKLDWERPVTNYLPDFRLGSADVTRRVLVKHLVCACTGLPGKDFEWLFNTRPDAGPQDTFVQLAATQPTSKFGETYQYSNLMGSAAGYLGGHVAFPNTEIGAAFDRAMQENVFDPLGMRDTTFSTIKATSGNWARPYDTDIYGRVAAVDPHLNDSIGPERPSGGAWSSAHDMALYVRNELEVGMLPNGKRLVSAKNLLARRAHNVPTDENVWYGMGIEDDASMGVSVLQHGGSLFGYKSNWFAIPSARVGVVVLTNSQKGYALTDAVKRRLLELLYDGKPEAVENVALAAREGKLSTATLRSELLLSMSPAQAKPYLGNYSNPDLGALRIGFEDGKLMARSTSFWSEIASKHNADGTVSLIPISPGVYPIALLAAKRAEGRAIVVDDGQHEYVFAETQTE